MNSDNETFSVSIKQTLLDHDQQLPPPPKHTRNKNLKKTISLLLILVVLVISSMILFSIYKNRRNESRNVYLSRSNRFYCHLTRYPELCYDSMSSIINRTVLKSTPGPIFSTSLQVAINELENISTISIPRALSFATNNSLVRPRLFECLAWVQDSSSRLNKSLGMLGVDVDVVMLTYEEMDNMNAWTWAARSNASKCFLALEEIGDVVEEGEEKRRVGEVKFGVEKAKKYMVNSFGLLQRRNTILFDFYNPFYEYEDRYSYVNLFYYHNVAYVDLIFLYSVMYLFLALLYFLFWRTK
ncbi:UNVERIFIED_CONTAM: hypothetical protein Sradi_4014100 [Sesamum radiatum]|uniref:Pectinesterase inhibitor domain-containing protein n=1 Tax=Sesamum radiatum TaxID=300843 RepID=A0AAW2PIF1_SESRA